jgi:hypothetical protein
VNKLHSQGFDDVKGKPLNRVPEFFHLLSQGESAEHLMKEPNKDGFLVTPRDDEGAAEYGHVIRPGKQKRFDRNGGGGGRNKRIRGIMVASDHPAILLPGDAA